MIRRLLIGLLGCACASSARAQVASGEPTPAESARAIGVQAAKDPAAAGAALNDLFRRLASPRVVLPTWQEVQQDRLRRDLAMPPARTEPIVDSAVDPVLPASIDPLGRRTRETVDVTLSRPLARVGLGAGWTGTDVCRYDQRVYHDETKYLFLSVDLSRVVRPARALPPPVTVDHVSTETSPARIRVRGEEYVVDSLKIPKD